MQVAGWKAAQPTTPVFDLCVQSSGCLCAVVSVGPMCCAEAGVAVAMLSGLF